MEIGYLWFRIFFFVLFIFVFVAVLVQPVHMQSGILFAEHEKGLPVSKSLCTNMQATLESTGNSDNFPSP